MSTAPSSTVLKAFSVLDLFREYPQVGVTQCSDLLGLPRPTAHRLLTSLACAGALERTGSGAYRLAIRMFEIGTQAPFFRSLSDHGRVAMEGLVAGTNLISHLAVRDGRDVVYLVKVSHQTGRVQTRIGLRNPLYATALGKVLLAHASRDIIEEVIAAPLDMFTPHTVPNAQMLCEQLVEVRRTGFGYDREERQLGVVCVATGIHDQSGAVVAALSVSAPAETHRQRLDELKAPLARAAKSITDSAVLGTRYSRQY